MQWHILKFKTVFESIEKTNLDPQKGIIAVQEVHGPDSEWLQDALQNSLGKASCVWSSDEYDFLE